MPLNTENDRRKLKKYALYAVKNRKWQMKVNMPLYKEIKATQIINYLKFLKPKNYLKKMKEKNDFRIDLVDKSWQAII